jgi:hypothetical protein
MIEINYKHKHNRGQTIIFNNSRRHTERKEMIKNSLEHIDALRTADYEAALRIDALRTAQDKLKNSPRARPIYSKQIPGTVSHIHDHGIDTIGDEWDDDDDDED